MITGFIEVFEDKLDKLKKTIKKELNKDKKEWNRDMLKRLLREAKDLKHIVKDAKKSKQSKITCPNCGHECCVD
jgi:uncharacterized ferredoxin-like protein